MTSTPHIISTLRAYLDIAAASSIHRNFAFKILSQLLIRHLRKQNGLSFVSIYPPAGVRETNAFAAGAAKRKHRADWNFIF